MLLTAAHPFDDNGKADDDQIRRNICDGEPNFEDWTASNEAKQFVSVSSHKRSSATRPPCVAGYCSLPLLRLPSFALSPPRPTRLNPLPAFGFTRAHLCPSIPAFDSCRCGRCCCAKSPPSG